MVRSELALMDQCGHVKPKMCGAIACTKRGIELLRREVLAAIRNGKQYRRELRAIRAQGEGNSQKSETIV